MWAIRSLNGDYAGRIYNLKRGRNLLGRASHCDIRIQSNSVSKEHFEISAMQGKLIITDLKSSNGTLLNGVRIQNATLKQGDKLSIQDLIFDVVPAVSEESQAAQELLTNRAVSTADRGQNQRENADNRLVESAGKDGQQNLVDYSSQDFQEPVFQNDPEYQASSKNSMINQFQKLKDYIEKVALPGVYHLAAIMEFKFVVMGFLSICIVGTALLSVIPMVRILREGIMTESKRRAMSLARTVGTLNQGAVLQENLSGLSIQSVDNEDGVKKVYIVRISDGVVLAPPSLAGTVPDIPFIQSARRDIRSFTAEVDLSTIGASFPIGAFDPNTGEQSVRALAIVFYDIGSISFDDARLLSLLFQTLLLSLIVGGIVFYFLYKLIEYPISNLNEQLDRCMREQRDDLQTNLIFPTYQHLISNVNSLLTRSLSSSSGSMGPIGGVNKHGEAENIVQLMGFPCATISNENKIISANSNFCQVARVAVDKMTGKGLEIIPDRAFQQNLEGLISRSRETPESILNDQLEFSGHNFLLSCATFRSGATQIDYFLVSISPLDRESEGGTG